MITKTKFKKIKSLELFSGAGGLAIGSFLAGCEHKGLIEWNQIACETLRLNSKKRGKQWNVIRADVRETDYKIFGEVDMVLGGPPCQPFSLGGKHQGMDDLRDMLPEFARSVQALKPKAFIMENVKGLLRPRFKEYFSYIVLLLSYPSVLKKPCETWEEHLLRLKKIHEKDNFTDLHYDVVYKLLNAADYGVPQVRERVFVVGFRSDLDVEWSFPQKTHSMEALLHSQWITGEYWKKHNLMKPKVIPGRFLKKVKKLNKEDLKLLPWKTVRDAISDLPRPSRSISSKIVNHEYVEGARIYPGHTGSVLDWPSKTLKAGAHGVPGGENMITASNGNVRYFTVREAARIQTFPDHWRFEGGWGNAMKQLGNAVPVQLAQSVTSSVVNMIS